MAGLADPVALVAAAGGLLAAVPVAASAHAAAASGPVRLPHRWWSNETPRLVSAISAVTTAAIAYAVCLRVGWHISTPGYWLFNVLGVGLSYTDIRRHRLPHTIIGTLWSVCAALFTIEALHNNRWAILAEAIGSGLAVSAALLLVALIAPGQLGLGDVHFAGAVAFTLGWFGWQVAVVAILYALVAQWILALWVSLRTGDRSARLPLGPALFGAWVVMVVVSARSAG